MSAIVNLVSNVWDAVVDTAEAIWDGIVDVATALWDEVLYPALTVIMGLFGIKDEDIISTEVITQSVFNTDEANKMFTTIALKRIKDSNTSVISNLITESMKVKEKYNGAYNYAKKKYSKGVPTTNIYSSTLDKTEVKAAVDDEYTVDSTISSAYKGALDKWEWAGYNLHNSHQYEASTKDLLYDDPLYGDTDGKWVVQEIDYNYDDGDYDVHIARTVNVETIVTVVTNDNGTPDDESDDYDEVTTRIIKTRVEDDLVLSDTESTETTEVGAVEESDTFSTENQADIIKLADYSLEIHAIAKYYTDNEDMWNYWVYLIGSGTYPELDANGGDSLQLAEFLPAVILRNNGVNTVANKDSTAYKEADDLLRLIGIDIDDLVKNINDNPDIDEVMDVIVNYTVNLNDNTPEVNKLLFNTFEELYLNTDLYRGGDHPTYVATIEESPYNIALMWKTQVRHIKDGSIGDIGTYTKSINGENLILRKQETDTQYVEYIMAGVSAVTFIDRAGLQGTVVKTLSEGIEMPVMFFTLSSLTPIEQTRLFPYTVKIHFYAASVTHLEWYQTGAFATFIQLLAIVIAIVVTVVTVGAGAPTSAYIIAAAEALAIGLVTSYALKLILDSSAPDWLKAALAVAVIILAATAGGKVQGGEFLSAAQLTDSVINMTIPQMLGVVSTSTKAFDMYMQDKMEELDKERTAFMILAEARAKQAEEKVKENDTQSNAWEVVALNSIQNTTFSSSNFFDIAKGSMQYDYGLLYLNPNEQYIETKLQNGII